MFRLGAILDLPFEALGVVCRAGKAYEARRSAAPATPAELKTIKRIANGQWIDDVKDIGSGT